MNRSPEPVFFITVPLPQNKKHTKILNGEIHYAKPKNENGVEDKNYNRIQTDRRGCGYGDWVNIHSCIHSFAQQVTHV